VEWMRERKYVKLRVDMYEDTKFKIIDMKPERDVIHYIWNRLVLLAGKVNLEGELFLSKNISYTIETLAIEFNREVSQIKLALETFIELQMVEFTEENIYKVKNFAKHQNIKVKKKEIEKQKDIITNNTDTLTNRNLEVEINTDKEKEAEPKALENRGEKLDESKEVNLEIANKDTPIAEDTIEDKIKGANSQKDNTISFETKKSRKGNKKKKDNDIAEEDFAVEESIDEEINGFTDGDKLLDKDESIVLEWSFG
jgi:predicted phage replisome organizer